MFAWIRWRQIEKHWRPRDAPCIAPPASPLLFVQDVAASRICAPTDEELPLCCAYCKEKIYGVRCFIRDSKDGVVHYGCLRAQQSLRKDEACQHALGHELHSLKSYLKRQRRHLHAERWNASRIKAKRRTAQMSIPDTSVAETPTAPVPSQPCEVPQIRQPVSLWSLATTFCSCTKRFFAKLWHCWPIRQCSLQCLSWLAPRTPRVSRQTQASSTTSRKEGVRPVLTRLPRFAWVAFFRVIPF